MSADTEKSLLLSAKETCRLVGIGRTKWLNMHAAGKCPSPVRLGRLVLWRRDEILKWVAAGCPSRQTWAMLKK